MTLRITANRDGSIPMLQLAGRLSAAEITALHREANLMRGPCVLEVSELRSADEMGLCTLRQLSSRGFELRGTSPYLQMLLDNE